MPQMFMVLAIAGSALAVTWAVGELIVRRRK
jgi:hypothetical protein